MSDAGVASSTDASGMDDKCVGAVLVGDLDGRVGAAVGDDGHGRRHPGAVAKVGSGVADRRQAPADQLGLVVCRDDDVHGERDGVGDRDGHASNVRPGSVGAQDERLEVPFGVAGLDWPDACPLDRGVHLHAVEHPSDNRAAPVAQQEDAVRGERLPDPLDQVVEVSRAQEVADLGDHDQVERTLRPVGGHFCAGDFHLAALGSGVRRQPPSCRRRPPQGWSRVRPVRRSGARARRSARRRSTRPPDPRVNRSRGSIARVSARLRCS